MNIVPECKDCKSPGYPIEDTPGDYTFMCTACMRLQTITIKPKIKSVKPVKIEPKREKRLTNFNIEDNLSGVINDD